MTNLKRVTSPLLTLSLVLLLSFIDDRPAAAEPVPAVIGEGPAVPAERDRSDLARIMRGTVRNWHSDSPHTENTLRVVYFHPADLSPQKDYQARIQRIMLDIQTFYRDEMERNGFGPVTYPLEIENGQLHIHVVRGREPASAYSYRSGGKVRREIGEALADVFDLDRSFTMIFHGLCRKEDDGRYIFFAPYYGAGDSNQRYGLCHAADCELLDTKLLTDTKRTIRYKEHTGDFTQSLADFNSKYLGGVAHELGHALGLVHNGQTRQEHTQLGTALMGSGNHTYRRERWGDGKGSFLSFASAVRLASHPLFTGSDRGRHERAFGRMTDLHFDRDGQFLLIEGRVDGRPAPYAVIAYADPDGRSDYDALTGVSTVKDGSFHVRVPCTRKPRQQLRLVLCLVNGSTVPVACYPLDIDASGCANTKRLNARLLASGPAHLFLEGHASGAAQRARQLLDRDDLPDEAVRRLKHILALAAPRPAPVEPAQAVGDEIAISDLAWKEAVVGWGRPARDHYYFDARVRDALLLETGSQFFEKGLYAHAPSRYVFKLDGRFRNFRSTGGLQAGTPSVGTAVFVVKGDGRELYRSEVIRGRTIASVDVRVEGIDSLELIVERGKEDNACCWSIWGAPTLVR
jgi:hypothetical protein